MLYQSTKKVLFTVLADCTQMLIKNKELETNHLLYTK